MHLGCCFQMHVLKPVRESRQVQLNYFSSEIKKYLANFGTVFQHNRLLPLKSAYGGCEVYKSPCTCFIAATGELQFHTRKQMYVYT